MSLIDTYNSQENILFISSYPEKGVLYSKQVCAVGGYTKNTLDALEGSSSFNTCAILTVTIGEKKELYEENGRLIWRIFTRNKVLSYFEMFKSILQFNKIKKVFIEFEFASFGDTKISVFFPLIVLVCKLTGKDITIVIHQVIDHIGEISGHLGWEETSYISTIKKQFYSYGLTFFYRSLVSLSNHVVVLEKEFKDRLIRMTGERRKISVIPHGVAANVQLIEKNEARRKLGLPNNKKIILYFGYLTWYKGADIFMNIANQNRKDEDTLFIVAGGPSFTQKNKKHYQEFLNHFKNPQKNVQITGFVNEIDIPLYFSACDAVILPYRVMMSSSGPLSLTFSYEKPLLISNKLKNYMKSEDFKNAMKTAQITEADLFFNPENKVTIEFDNDKLARLGAFSKEMKRVRDFRLTSKRLMSS